MATAKATATNPELGIITASVKFYFIFKFQNCTITLCETAMTTALRATGPQPWHVYQYWPPLTHSQHQKLVMIASPGKCLIQHHSVSFFTPCLMLESS